MQAPITRLLALAAILLAPFAAAQTASPTQTGKPTAIPSTPPPTQPPTDRRIPRLAAPLTLADFAGMKPSPAIVGQVAEITGFTQSSPSDGQPATQKTQVFLGYTPTTLYAVFLCFDTHPSLIRSHLARRENITADDNVSILLDPFQDHRRGVLFQLNPAGVQADAAWTESSSATTSNADYSYDQVWDSNARITPHGWMALFAIPFTSLRSHPGTPGWGIVLTRSIPRNSETDSWPHIATSITGTLTQEGTLLGIAGVTASRNFQINPYALAQNEHTLLALDPNNPYFSTRHLEGTAGGDAKAILHDTVVLDLTLNPDFSQVESNQPQFTVNQRYPVYFPELRPFFLENANYFSTPIDLLYTRNIVHPEFGARLTGKLGHTNLGLLTIDDRSPGEAFAPGAPDHDKHALFAVGRVTEDIGKGSSLGLIYTDYEFAGSFNRIGGLDFTARFNDKWTALGQIVESATKTLPGATVASTILGASYQAQSQTAGGPASWLEVTRNGHSFNLDNTYQDYSTGFASQVGFITTADIRNDRWHSQYQWYPKHSFLQSYGLETSGHASWDHQGNRVERYTTIDPFLTLPRETVLAPLLILNSDTLGPQDGYAIPANINLTQNAGGLVVRSAPARQLNWNIVFSHGGNPNFNPAPGQPPSLLHEEYLQALVSVLPFHSLTVDNTYLLDRNHTARTGADVYESQTLRTKLNYQFTRALSARVIVEYDSVLVNPAQTSLVRTKQVATQALLTWLPHPGTAIYLGYNNDLQNLNHNLCQSLPASLGAGCDPTQPILPRSNNYLNDGRQFFLKASYLFRF